MKLQRESMRGSEALIAGYLPTDRPIVSQEKAVHTDAIRRPKIKAQKEVKDTF